MGEWEYIICIETGISSSSFFTHDVLGSYLRFVFHIASSILGIAEPRHFFVSFFLANVEIHILILFIEARFG